QICPKVPGQKFVNPPFKEEIKTLFEVKVEILPQPWRTFETIINKCLSAYKTYYAFATRKEIPKPKYVHRSVKEKTEQAPKASFGKRIKSAAKVTRSGKKKQIAEGLETLSEAEQMKLPSKEAKHNLTALNPAALVHMKELVLHQGFSMYLHMNLMMSKYLERLVMLKKMIIKAHNFHQFNYHL
nr:hypothetical protein [Tanacetum cinerariifolium]